MRVTRGRVVLEARTVWEYNVYEYRTHPVRPVRAFLPGVYADWALEVAAGLEGLLERRTLN